MTLLEACDADDVFDFPLYPGQRKLLDQYEQGLALGDRTAVWCIGRRSGKSTLAGLVGLWCCLLRPDLDELSGIAQRSIAVVICPTEKQAQELLDGAEVIVKRSPLLRDLLVKSTKNELEFANGTRFAVFPASSRSVVGRAVRCFILDEAAHFFDNESGAHHEVDRIYNAMMPATAQFQGKAPVLVTSTPAGDANWFGQLVTKARKGELKGTRVFHASSQEMNPTLTEEFLQAEQERDPESYRGEYLAELIGSGGAFIDPESVDLNVAPRLELRPGELVNAVAGFDPSFSKDPAAVTIVGRDFHNPDRLRVGYVQTWIPDKGQKMDAAGRRALEDRLLTEVCDTLQRYGVRTVVTDNYAAGIVNEALARRGFWVEPYPLTMGSKLEMFLAVKARLLNGTLELYEHETLVAELKRLRSQFRGGSRQVETPRLGGTHCDSAIALALAVQFIDRDGAPGTALPFMVTHDEPLVPSADFAPIKALERTRSVGDYVF